jgi:thymidylate kinase
LVVFLDATPQDAISRLQKGQKRVQDHNLFENLEVQTRIRNAYWDVFNFHKVGTNLQSTNILRINAELPVKQIKRIIGARVSMLLKKKTIERKKNIKKNNGNLEEFFSISQDFGTSRKKGAELD